MFKQINFKPNVKCRKLTKDNLLSTNNKQTSHPNNTLGVKFY